MKKVKLFEDYVEIQNEIFNLDENQYDNTIEELDSIIENFENAEEINEGLVGQLIGWYFFTPFMLIRQGYRFLKKRQKIKKMLAAPNLTPAKKEKLKQELKKLKYEEVKAKEKVEAKKEEMRAKAKAKKKDMSPKERKQFQKEMDKKKKELENAQAKLDKEMDKFHGLEV